MANTGIKIGESLTSIRLKMNEAVETRSVKSKEPLLVAVSKTKPLDLVREAYECGQRHFGENYMKELITKSNNPDLLELCPDIKWHYIGSFTKKMAAPLTRVSNLHMLETISCPADATAVDKRWKGETPLKVLVQVNTSGEESKSGVSPDEAISLATHIHGNCPNLRFGGLMSIGSRGHDYTAGPNPDFEKLVELRGRVAGELPELKVEELELSMGMSGDFPQAIESGSTIIRIGTQIFGARDYANPT